MLSTASSIAMRRLSTKDTQRPGGFSRIRRALFSSASPRVTKEIESDGICTVTLNRPNKLNAVDMSMFEAIAETAHSLRDNKNVRAVILRGEGRSFCTGLDVVRNNSRVCWRQLVP